VNVIQDLEQSQAGFRTSDLNKITMRPMLSCYAPTAFAADDAITLTVLSSIITQTIYTGSNITRRK